MTEEERAQISRIIDNELGNIEVSERGNCRWTGVVNAQTHIEAQLRSLTQDTQAECGEKRIQLTGQWSLRKLQLADRSEWALQYLGMDWLRLCEFLPSKNDTSMDDDIRKFADSVRDLMAGEPPTLAPLDDRLRTVDLRSVIQNVITRCHDRGEGFDIMALEAACAVRDALRGGDVS